MRTPIRLSSLMEIPSLWVMTHDSIGLGEDGPTHQPIEQLAALRAVPHLLVYRPADANEVVECWRSVLSNTHRPSLFVLSRQPLPPTTGANSEPRAAPVAGHTFWRRPRVESRTFSCSPPEARWPWP